VAVRLTWTGRDDRPLDQTGALQPSAASFGRLIEGDNVSAMRALLAEEGTFGLAYLDPPYMSGTDYMHEGVGQRAYGDRWTDRDAYLSMLWPVLRLVHRLLGNHGTIWVQVDHRASGLVQPLLDELFGPERLRNVIAWRRAPPLGRQVQSRQFPRNLDLLFAYAKGDDARWRPLQTRMQLPPGRARKDKEGRWYTLAPRGDYTDESVARLEQEGRIYRSDAGKVYVKYFVEEIDGVLYKPRAVDAVWDDVAPLRHASPKERTGYPTQKPEPLLRRILEATSNPGDKVLDPFAGSGTTGVVASTMERPYVLIDESPVAITTTRARLPSVELVKLERT
jgi:DNA modification methylase